MGHVAVWRESCEYCISTHQLARKTTDMIKHMITVGFVNTTNSICRYMPINKNNLHQRDIFAILTAFWCPFEGTLGVGWHAEIAFAEMPSWKQWMLSEDGNRVSREPVESTFGQILPIPGFHPVDVAWISSNLAALPMLYMLRSTPFKWLCLLAI